jgi:hypothetical protein
MAKIEGRGLRVVGEAEAGSEDLLGECLLLGRQVFKRCGGLRDNLAGAGGLDRGQTRCRGGFRPELLTRTAMETYLGELAARGYSTGHRAKARSAASGVVQWLIEEKDLLRRHPAGGVEVPPRQ